VRKSVHLLHQVLKPSSLVFEIRRAIRTRVASSMTLENGPGNVTRPPWRRLFTAFVSWHICNKKIEFRPHFWNWAWLAASEPISLRWSDLVLSYSPQIRSSPCHPMSEETFNGTVHCGLKPKSLIGMSYPSGLESQKYDGSLLQD